VDAVLHLAGEPVADKRWTEAHKALIRDSRVLGTRALVQAVLAHGAGVRVFVHGSASGIHGERGDELLDAHSSAGTGYLADVVRAWEAELAPLAARPALRVPVVRTGIVLARQGGALAQMLPLFRLSAAGRLGDGAQWMSWIHLQDIVGLFLHALDAPAATGVLEGVAPQPVTNAQFTRAFTRSLGAIQNLPVPRAAIEALYGERADIVLGSTRLVPTATLAAGYRFRFETVEHALEDLLAPLRGGVWERVWEHWLPQPASEVWPFFASARTWRRSRRRSSTSRCWACPPRDRRRHAHRLRAARQRRAGALADADRCLGSRRTASRHSGARPVRPVAPRARVRAAGRRHADARHRALPAAGRLARHAGGGLEGGARCRAHLCLPRRADRRALWQRRRALGAARAESGLLLDPAAADSPIRPFARPAHHDRAWPPCRRSPTTRSSRWSRRLRRPATRSISRRPIARRDAWCFVRAR
jgi:uncharacterized protein